MISHVMLEKPALVSFSKSSNSAHSSDCFDGFEKLTCACYFRNFTGDHDITYSYTFSQCQFGSLKGAIYSLRYFLTIVILMYVIN